MDEETSWISVPQTPASRLESGVGGNEDARQGAWLEGLLGGVSGCSSPLHLTQPTQERWDRGGHRLGALDGPWRRGSRVTGFC